MTAGIIQLQPGYEYHIKVVGPGKASKPSKKEKTGLIKKTVLVGKPDTENKGGQGWREKAKKASVSSRDHTRILKKLRNGMAVKDIVAEFKGKYNGHQVAALGAWVTMGKY